MRKAAIFIALALLLVLGATPALANGIPKLPHAFYGSVTINGAPAPDGTEVSATVNIGEIIATQNPVTTVGGNYGVASPYLLVQGYDIPDEATITFYVDGVEVEGSTNTFVAGGGPTRQNLDLVSDIIAQKVATIPAGQTGYVIDFSTEANTTITVNTSAQVTTTVKKYVSNPHPEVALPANMLPRFIDIEIDNLDAINWLIRVEHTYTDAEVSELDESTLKTCYFKAGAWHACSSTGVNTATNTIWANMTRTELSGSPVAFGGQTAEPAPVGGGGGGAAPAITTLSLTGLVATPSLRVDAQGIVQTVSQLKTADGKLILDIDKGTKLLDALGNRLAFLSSALQSSPPPAPSGEVIVIAYNLDPNGATFSPAITLTIQYDPAGIPEDIAEEDLVIAYYDGAEWVEVDSEVDTEENTITASILHFTTFAVIGTPLPPEPAAFEVSNLSIQPTEVQPEEVVTVTVLVTNTGGTEGSHTVVLNINGVKEDENSVTLDAGQSQEVSFSVSRDKSDSYAVAVDGLSGSFTVVEPEEVPPVKPAVNWPLIGGIIGAVVVVVLLVIFLVVRRRA